MGEVGKGGKRSGEEERREDERRGEENRGEENRGEENRGEETREIGGGRGTERFTHIGGSAAGSPVAPTIVSNLNLALTLTLTLTTTLISTLTLPLALTVTLTSTFRVASGPDNSLVDSVDALVCEQKAFQQGDSLD